MVGETFEVCDDAPDSCEEQEILRAPERPPASPVDPDLVGAAFIMLDEDSNAACTLPLLLQVQLVLWGHVLAMQEAKKARLATHSGPMRTAWPEEVKLLLLEAWDKCEGRNRQARFFLHQHARYKGVHKGARITGLSRAL